MLLMVLIEHLTACGAHQMCETHNASHTHMPNERLFPKLTFPKLTCRLQNDLLYLLQYQLISLDIYWQTKRHAAFNLATS